MKSLKQWLPDVLVVIIFVGISFAYFFPADIEGRILYRHDSSANRGAGQEAHEYNEQTGKVTRWTNALFGGMPTYQMAVLMPIIYGCQRMCGMCLPICWASTSCYVPLISVGI